MLDENQFITIVLQLMIIMQELMRKEEREEHDMTMHLIN